MPWYFWFAFGVASGVGLILLAVEIEYRRNTDKDLKG